MRQYSSKPLPWQGKVRIMANSSLRKLARAARRNMIPPERMIVIEEAMSKARRRK